MRTAERLSTIELATATTLRSITLEGTAITDEAATRLLGVAASLEDVSFAHSSNLCLLVLNQTAQQLRKLNVSYCSGLASLEASFSGKVNLNISGCRELQRLMLHAEQFEGAWGKRWPAVSALSDQLEAPIVHHIDRCTHLPAHRSLAA